MTINNWLVDNIRKRKNVFCTLIIVVLFIIPVNMLTVVAPKSDNGVPRLDDAEESFVLCENSISPRSVPANYSYINHTDFSSAIAYDTYINPDNTVGLAWDRASAPYEKDYNTYLLSHFEHSYKGVDEENALVIDKNLVGYWDMNDGAGVVTEDQSLNRNHGSLINGPVWEKEPSGHSLRFDGANDHIVTDFNPVENEPFTVEAWLKISSASGEKMIVGTYGGSSTGFWFEVINNDLRSYHYKSSGSSSISGSENLALNTWYFVSLVYNGTHILHYLNGKQTNSLAADLDKDFTATSNQMLIGAIGSQITSLYIFNGNIASVKFYNRGKTTAELVEAYNQQASKFVGFNTGKFGNGLKIGGNETVSYQVRVSPDPSCLGKWTFYEGSGLTANDTSGNGHTGRLLNGTKWINGYDGNGIELDGSNDLMEVYPFKYDLSETTIEFWMKSSDTTNEGTAVSCEPFGTSSNELMVYNYKNIKPYIDGASSTTGISANDGNWHYITMTWVSENGALKVYKDGKEEYSGTLKTGVTLNIADVIIGQDQDAFRGNFQSSQAFKGVIDEVGIYKRAKTAEEIKNDYLSYRNLNDRHGTLEMWVKPNWNGNDNKNHTIFFCGNETINNSFFIYKDTSNRLRFKTYDDKKGTANNPWVNIGGWQKNQWYHLAFSWNPQGTKRIYIDGELRAEQTGNKMPNSLYLYTRLFIGSVDEEINGFDGTIDELRISKTELSPDEFREYRSPGYLISPGIDAGEIVEWGLINWSSVIPPDTELYLQTRISNDNSTWTNWTGNVPGTGGEWYYTNSVGESINQKQSRYLQWQAVLISDDGVSSPILEWVNLSWNHIPKALNVTFTPDEPNDLDDIIINYTYYDFDNDTEDDTKFEWFVNKGVGFVYSGIDNQILDSSNTNAGERWYFVLTAHDGNSYGVPFKSDIIIITKGPLYRIDITPNNVTMTSLNKTLFKARAYDQADNIITTTFEWSITGGGIIDQAGLFSAESTGLHGIYATAGDVVGYAVAHVIPGPINKVSIEPKDPVVSADEAVQFHGIVVDEKNNMIHDLPMNWSISGDESISDAGLYSPIKVGAYLITLNVSGIKSTTTVTVFPGRPAEVDLLNGSKNPEISTDSEHYFEVEAIDEDGNPVPVPLLWEAESGQILHDGRYIPDEIGTWNVTGSVVGTELSVKTQITVVVGEVCELQLSPSVHVLKVNDSVQFSVDGFDCRNNHITLSTVDVDWSVSDKSLGYIDSAGKFNAVKPGELIVTAKYTIPEPINDTDKNVTNGNGNGDDNKTNGNNTNGNNTNGNNTRARNGEIITGSATITIYEVPVAPEPDGDSSEVKKGDYNFNFLLIIIILVIIIVLLLVLFLMGRRKGEGRRREPKVSGEGEELDEEYTVEDEEEEAKLDAQDEEWTEADDEYEEESAAEDWEVIDDESSDEDEDAWKTDDSKAEEKSVPKKGKIPKGKFPAEQADADEDEDIWD